MNFIECHIHTHLDELWNWDMLSSNPTITSVFVAQHLDLSWRWGRGGLSKNPSIHPEFIKKHPDRPWFWGEDGISSNTSITRAFYEETADKPWTTKGLSANTAISPEWVGQYPRKRWNKVLLAANPAMTQEFIETWLIGRPPLKAYVSPSILEAIAQNPNISLDFIAALFMPYQRTITFSNKLSLHPAITEAFHEKYKDYPWDWPVYQNPSLSMSYIEKHCMSLRIHLADILEHLMSNPSITMEFIKKYTRPNTQYHALIYNPGLTFECARELVPLSLPVYGLIENAAIPIQWISDRMGERWETILSTYIQSGPRSHIFSQWYNDRGYVRVPLNTRVHQEWKSHVGRILSAQLQPYVYKSVMKYV